MQLTLLNWDTESELEISVFYLVPKHFCVLIESSQLQMIGPLVPLKKCFIKYRDQLNAKPVVRRSAFNEVNDRALV